MKTYCELATAGAVGYLVKQGAAADIVTAIREAKKDNAFFSPVITKRLVEFHRQSCGKRLGNLARRGKTSTTLAPQK